MSTTERRSAFSGSDYNLASVSIYHISNLCFITFYSQEISHELNSRCRSANSLLHLEFTRLKCCMQSCNLWSSTNRKCECFYVVFCCRCRGSTSDLHSLRSKLNEKKSANVSTVSFPKTRHPPGACKRPRIRPSKSQFYIMLPGPCIYLSILKTASLLLLTATTFLVAEPQSTHIMSTPTHVT